MELTVLTFLFICLPVFFAGLTDAIGGGGGLISLPAYLIAVFLGSFPGARVSLIANEQVMKHVKCKM